MNFDVACYSEQGGRPVNEDAVFAAGTPGTLLTLVADGLGGMGHGDLASSDAAEHLSRLSAHPVDEDMLCGAILEELLRSHEDPRRRAEISRYVKERFTQRLFVIKLEQLYASTLSIPRMLRNR